MTLIFVDTESEGGACPGLGRMTQFGLVDYATRDEFYGDLRGDGADVRQILLDAKEWIEAHTPENDRPIMVSDNPAWDFQWINHYFLVYLGSNPFGHSARRIGDYYAGLVGDFSHSVRWKRLRVTKHDHHPVHDARGNVEAFEAMQKQYDGLRGALSRINMLSTNVDYMPVIEAVDSLKTVRRIAAKALGLELPPLER